MSVILTWLMSSGASLILGFAAQVIKDMVADARNRQAIEDLATARAERDQTKGTLAATQASLDAAVNAPKNVPDAIKALREGIE